MRLIEFLLTGLMAAGMIMILFGALVIECSFPIGAGIAILGAVIMTAGGKIYEYMG